MDQPGRSRCIACGRINRGVEDQRGAMPPNPSDADGGRIAVMTSTTIVFSIVLILLGFAGYFGTGTSSLTALIPAFFGLVMLILGILARSDAARKHAMHAAATVALVGLIGALFSLLRTPLDLRPAMAVFSQVAMIVLMAIFLALCIKSFRDSRRARAARL